MIGSPRVAHLVRLGGEFFWVSAGQAFAAVGALVGVRLLTEVLPPGPYGMLALGVSVTAVVQMSILQPLYEGSLRFYHAAAEGGELAAFLAALQRLAALVTVGLSAASVLVLVLLVQTGHSSLLVLGAATAVVSMITTWTVTISGIQNAARQRLVVAWHDSLTQWLRFGLAATFVWWAGESSGLAMSGYAVASGPVLASQVWFLRRTSATSPVTPRPMPADIDRWKARVIAYAWPFAAWGSVMAVQVASGRWSLQVFHGSETVGLYAALNQAGYYPIVLLVGVFSQFASPVIFRRVGIGDDAHRAADARRLGTWLVVAAMGLTATATGIAILLHRQVFAAVVAPEYRQVSHLLPLVVLGSGLFASAQAASVLPMIAADTRALMTPKIASAAVGTLLNFFAASKYGLPGVVYSGVVYGAMSCLWVTKSAGLFSREQGNPGAGQTSSKQL